MVPTALYNSYVCYSIPAVTDQAAMSGSVHAADKAGCHLTLGFVRLSDAEDSRWPSMFRFLKLTGTSFLLHYPWMSMSEIIPRNQD